MKKSVNEPAHIAQNTHDKDTKPSELGSCYFNTTRQANNLSVHLIKNVVNVVSCNTDSLVRLHPPTFCDRYYVIGLSRRESERDEVVTTL